MPYRVLSRSSISGKLEENSVVFSGENYQYAEDTNIVQNISNTTNVTKVTLTTPSLPLGDYVLEYDGIWYAANANRTIRFHIYDGVTLLREIIWQMTNVNERMPIFGTIELPNISGVKTYTMQFRVGPGSGTTMTMSFGSLRIRRVNHHDNP
jgi:hypothetical protein